MHPNRRGGVISDLAKLLAALEFAAYKHRFQKRKGKEASPYINHPIAVAKLLATVGSVTDLPTLVAAVLHDTVEDTKTTKEELEEQFGREVRDLVMEVTDDKKLPKPERKRLQIEHAGQLSPKAKLIKLGDKIANVRDVAADPPADWTTEDRREYLDWTEEVVRGCRRTNAALEGCYDESLREARAKVG
jgi:(p)ppGpp synthase/HD superfamily hydrolase